VVGLVESDRVVSVDREVSGVDVVALEHHLEDLWLVHSALLHEVYDLVLHDDCMVNVVIQLHLDLILKLAALVKWLLVLNWLSEVLVVLGQEVHFADVGP